ncbi:MAG: DUF3459 domain-containing protein [Planctomycetota bacterium]|nr:MAG: DUF3459 domain-containing protein [Planctomycetota bacterium]
MGATLYTHPSGTGTSFRVWAPNASQVYVSGLFNGWYGTSAPLASEGNGNWSLDVRNLGHGAHYRYVLDTVNGQEWKNDPRAKDITNSIGDSIVHDPSLFPWSGSFSTPNWNEMVIYEMHIGTFYDNPGSAVGTFDRAIQKLDYLADLGINVIELMPICEFPGDYSWGYNYAHPFTVESSYGGVWGLKNFIQEAHDRGIAVLIDVLYNHWGPNDLDMWRFDGWGLSTYGGIYFYNDWRAVTAWGDTRPDYGRGEVRQYIRDNALYWLEECRADGLRWDSTVNIRTQNNGFGGDLPDGWSLMQWVNNEIDWFQGWKISIAEDLWSNEWITKDTGVGGAGFDSQWDSDFVHPVRNEIVIPDDNNRNMYALRDAIYHYYNGDAFQRVIYTESHDEVANGRSRVPEEIWPGNAGSWYSKKRSTLGGVLVMTSPGIPMIFQGQELLEDEYFRDDDPLDWNKLNLYGGIHDMYRDLIRLRRNWYNNTRGLKGQGVNVHHVNNNDKVIAFHRWDQGGGGDDVIVVVNLRDRSYNSYNLGFPHGGTWRVRFNSDWNGYDSSFGNHPSWDVQANSGTKDGMPYNGNLSIGPYTAVILSQ